MHMTISQEAVSFYKTEIPLQPGDALRLFVRVGGVGSGGFSVGVQKDEPEISSYRMIHEDITFFVNEDDFWYMDGMVVEYNPIINLMTFTTQKWKNSDHPE